MDWHRLHPIAVHYPVALLTLGLAAALAAELRGFRDRLAEAASWLLWLGAASAWAALGLGLVAERTAPHVPPAWELLAEHETLAWWTAGCFSALSAWRFWSRAAGYRAGKAARAAFLAAWAGAVGLLAATAHHGGQLVYGFGLGVAERE